MNDTTQKNPREISPKDDELVLVIPRSVLNDAMYFNGVMLGNLILARIIQLGTSGFVTRGECESNPNLKQIIPYVIIRYINLDKGEVSYLRYSRASEGEKRLFRKQSIGVGGHVNPCDAAQQSLPGIAPRAFCAQDVLSAAEREIAEELGSALVLSPADRMPCFVGLINDDNDPVGLSHLAVIMVLDVTAEEVENLVTNDFSGNLAGKVDAFVPIEKLFKESSFLEEWSKLLLIPLLYGPVEAFNPA